MKFIKNKKWLIIPKSSKIKRKNKRILIGVGAIIATLIVVGILGVAGFFNQLVPVSPSNTSSFTLSSSIDGEDVSDFVEISVWVPDDDAEFDEVEDIYTWSNFEEEESSKDAADVSIDLRDYEYVWVEIDPDGDSVFMNNHHLIVGGANADFTYDVYDLSTDVNFGVFTNVSAPTWFNFSAPFTGVGNVPYGFDWDDFDGAAQTMADQTQDNLTLVMDVEHFTQNGTHVGTNWDVEQTKYDEMSDAEKEEMHDEALWQCQAPQYIPVDDLEKEGDGGLESLTNAFAIRWTYNTTVSTTDAATTQVNMTITDDTEAEVVIDGTYIYIIFYEVLDFSDGPVTVAFEYQEGQNIYCNALESGRINVPRDEDSLGTFTIYSPTGY